MPGVRERGWLKLADGSGWLLEDGRALGFGRLLRRVAATAPRAAVSANDALKRTVYELFDSPPCRAPTLAACDASEPAIARGLALVRRSLASAGLGGPFLERPEAWTGAVDVLERADQWRFEDYVERNAPVLLRGALADWAPVKKWTDAYVRKRCGGARPISVRRATTADVTKRDGKTLFGRPDKANLYDDHTVALADYLDDDPDRPYYAARVDVGRELPELLTDLDAAGPPGGLQSAFGPPMPSNPILYFGRGSDPRGELDGLMLGRGVFARRCRADPSSDTSRAGDNATPTHFDPDENLFCMVDGAKVVTLHHPGDGDCLYPSGDRNAKSVFSLVDPRLDGAEIAARFPKTAAARPLEVTVRKGDMLYIPLGWWHFIRALPGRNMSINYWYRLSAAKTSSDGLLREFERLYVAKRPPRKSP